MAKKQSAPQAKRRNGNGNGTNGGDNPAPTTAAMEVLEPETPELKLTVMDGASIVSWLQGLVPFFRKAGALEEAAKATLVQAKHLKPATTADEDVELQRFVKGTSIAKRAVEDHWEITSIVSAFHKRLTAKRKVATEALDEANSIGNGLHNRWVETEKRRASIEQERLRIEAETQARLDRERDLAAAEERALNLELEMENLSEREQVFVDQVLAGKTPIQAANIAGFQDALKASARLMASEKVIKAIAAKQEANAIREQATAVRQQPINVEVETVRPNISRGSAGGFDRSTHSAELLDENALREACFAGGYGIPHDILVVSEAKLNEYARGLRERINLWPGVRYKKTTKVI